LDREYPVSSRPEPKYASRKDVLQAIVDGDLFLVDEYYEMLDPEDQELALETAIGHAQGAMIVFLVERGVDPFCEVAEDMKAVDLMRLCAKDFPEEMEPRLAAIRRKYPEKYVEWWCAQK
jgi:hypothetical protein